MTDLLNSHLNFFTAGILYEAQATARQLIREKREEAEKVSALKSEVKSWCQEALTIVNIEQPTSPFAKLRPIMKAAMEEVCS